LLVAGLLATGCGATTDPLAPTPVPPPPRTADFGFYRANVQRTGAYTSTGVPYLHGLLWTHDGSQVAPAVAAHSRIYAVSSGALAAIDATTGSEQWYAPGSLTPPAIADGHVYYGWQDTLYAADAETSNSLWTFQTGNDIESAPAVMGDSVYFGSNDGYLYALDAQTGQQQWKVRGGDHVFSEPAVTTDTVYFAGSTMVGPAGGDTFDAEARLYAVDSRTGDVRWTFKPARSVYSPLADGDFVYCVTGNDSWSGKGFLSVKPAYLYAVDSRTGQMAWKYLLDGREVSPPALANGLLYVGSGDRFLLAIDAKTGQERWRIQTGSHVSGVSAAAGMVYFGTSDKLLHAVDGRTGREKWSFQTPAGLFGAPVIGDGVIIFVDGEHVYALQ
jgi:outer membrane protein assembly factor BamB